jgi:hypothetical protein
MNGIMVTPAQASTLLVSTSTAWIAGAAHSVTVTARDAYGNTATGYRGTIHFTGTDTHATLPADYTFVQSDSGSHRFNLGATLSTAGTQSIRARDTAASSITGLQTGIVVGPATLTTFAVSGFPKSDVAGASHGFTVRAVDAYGNTVSSYRGTVHLTGTDVKTVLPPDYTFTATDAGSHTFSVTLKTAGTQSIRARDTVTATITALQTGIVVIPAAASVLTVSGVPTTDAAGTSHSMTVKVLDAYGNTATAYRGSVHFTSTDPKAVLPADYAFTATDAGSHTFSVALKTAGSQSIRARDKVATAVTGLESGITVTPGAASTLSVYGFPSADVAGAAHSITVKALDAYGNTATGYRGTVHLTSTDATANLPANYAFTATDAGIHTFSVTLKTAGTQSIQARDTVTASITGTETAITVGPGVTFTALPNPALRGTTASLTVRTSPGATCSIIVTWPSGTVSSAAGLKTTPTAGSSGLVSWTWNVASNTITGTASAAVTCTFNGVSSQGSANFTVS